MTAPPMMGCEAPAGWYGAPGEVFAAVGAAWFFGAATWPGARLVPGGTAVLRVEFGCLPVPADAA